jgi:putative transposon-encoded protein
MNIKITRQEREIKGKLESGTVKPFGTSAHIPFSKKHMGKKINVVISDNSELVWVLTEKEKQTAIKDYKSAVKEDYRNRIYNLGIIERIKKNNFSLKDLENFTYYLEQKNPSLAIKINKIYGV